MGTSKIPSPTAWCQHHHFQRPTLHCAMRVHSAQTPPFCPRPKAAAQRGKRASELAQIGKSASMVTALLPPPSQAFPDAFFSHDPRIVWLIPDPEYALKTCCLPSPAPSVWWSSARLCGCRGGSGPGDAECASTRDCQQSCSRDVDHRHCLVEEGKRGPRMHASGMVDCFELVVGALQEGGRALEKTMPIHNNGRESCSWGGLSELVPPDGRVCVHGLFVSFISFPFRRNSIR